MALILEPGLAREIESQLLSFSRVESTRFAAQRDCDKGYFTGRAGKNYWRDIFLRLDGRALSCPEEKLK